MDGDREREKYRGDLYPKGATTDYVTKKVLIYFTVIVMKRLIIVIKYIMANIRSY